MYTDFNLESIQNSTFYALKFHSAATHIIYDYYSRTSIIRTSIIRTIRLSGLFSMVPIFSWILISCDLENSKSQKAK